jgi:hypothetical protein
MPRKRLAAGGDVTDPRQEDVPPEASPATSASGPPAEANPTADDQHRRIIAGLAGNLRHIACAAYLCGSMAKTFTLDGDAFKAYRDTLVMDAGNPTDPIEVMLIEQLMMAHHNVGRLHMQAAAARDPEEARICNAAAVRLMAEFRRSALALKSYRVPAGPRHFTAVKQLNLAGGGQQIALVEGRANPGPEAPLSSLDTELGSTRALGHANPHHIPQPEAGRSRPAEPVETARAHTRGSRAAAAGGAGASAVATCERAADGGGQGAVGGQREGAAGGAGVGAGAAVRPARDPAVVPGDAVDA